MASSPAARTPQIQETDGFYGGDFINGNLDADAGAYPPYGPSDTSRPPQPEPLSYSLNDPFPFLAQFMEGTKAILAVELASASGMEPLPSTQKRAQKAYSALLAYYVIAPKAGQDIGLTWMPSSGGMGPDKTPPVMAALGRGHPGQFTPAFTIEAG